MCAAVAISMPSITGQTVIPAVVSAQWQSCQALERVRTERPAVKVAIGDVMAWQNELNGQDGRSMAAAVDRLFAGGTVLCDGAMGTMLYARCVHQPLL